MKVVVLGTGTAGLITALVLKKVKPMLEVSVIGSPNIGIVGVGESSTEHFNDLKNILGCSLTDIIKGCHATYKFGVYFEGWTDKDYVHSITSKLYEENAIASKLQQNTMMQGMIANNFDPLDMVDKTTIEPYMLCDLDFLPSQFHFDTFKLNEFLRNHCEKLDVKIYEDDVTPVFADDGSCDGLIGSNNDVYSGDLYVDASGFQKAIIGEMPQYNWISDDNLFLDSAIAFQCEHPENYRCYTTAKRMKNGWMWRIPTYTRMGNGYAFNSQFCSEEEALDEIEEFLGFRPTIGRRFKFDAGRMNTFWENNVVAIGLSSHFYEPLEATAIGVGIQQAFLLSKYIGSENEDTKRVYNEQNIEMLNQVSLYLQLHYANVPPDTPFWEMVKGKIDYSPSKELDRILKILHNRMLTEEDVNGTSSLNLFGQINFNQVAYGLGILKSDTIQTEWEMRNLQFQFENMMRTKLKQEERNLTNPRHIDLINMINESEE